MSRQLNGTPRRRTSRTFRALLLGAALGAAMTAQGGEIALPALEALPPAQIVLLGEVHDNPDHHLAQARALAALHPSAVVFEMLTPVQAAIVNGTRDRGDVLAGALGWGQSGWPDWALYAPVFAALGDARIYGAALPGEVVRKAVGTGAAAQFPGDAARFGLTTALPTPEQSAREAEQREAHCNALPEDLLAGMVAAQRLRDAAFAQTSLQALADTGGPVAVIAGTGHVRKDWGMPAALAHAAPEVTVLAIGQLEGAPDEAPPFDLWLIAPPPDRDDPCKDFLPRKDG